jgi:hypothetical protein
MNTTMCACDDPGCPVHIHRHCSADAGELLYAMGADNPTPTPMCQPCAGVALESGLFRTA